MKLLILGCLVLAAPVARADDAVEVEVDAHVERVHRTENAIAASVTAGLLGYESVQLFRAGWNTEPGGGLVDLSELGKGVDYTLGTLTALASASMVGLAVHDIVSDQPRRTPRAERIAGWTLLVLEGGLATYGLTQLGDDDDHGAAAADIWVGGTGALVSATLLLHMRAPVPAHSKLAITPTAHGIAVTGAF